MYGSPLGAGGAMTEIPFLLNGKIERIYKDAVDLQDLEADIAIANFTRDPLNSGNETGWNYVRLPKVKVQLAIQAEHWDEYICEWVDGITHNFDGSIIFPFNAPFWNFDTSRHEVFSRETWIAKNAPIKPFFTFDPLVKWNGFYQGPITKFGDYGCAMGSTTIHRERVVKNNNQIRHLFGDVRDLNLQNALKESGIGINIHKFQIKGKCPETNKLEIKYVPKTESIRLAFFYNLGMAVVSEELDDTFPERLKNCIEIVEDMEKYQIDKDYLLLQTLETKKVFNEYHDLETEFDNLITAIVKEYNL